MRRILVIRYGGFGDVVLSMPAFRTIRAHHAGDRIAALTTAPFRDLLRASGYFDDVLLDQRLKPWRLGGWMRQARLLRGQRFDRVYDLQRNERTAILYRIIGAGRPLEWSGVIRGCSHFVRDDLDDRRHIADRIAEQLAVAGIREIVAEPWEWLTADVAGLGVPERYALIVPGGAPRRPEKRAPAEAFAALARHLVGEGITPVLIGTVAERAAIDAIVDCCPGAVNLCDRTGYAELAELARNAIGAVGNDTGAMHLAAAVGCPALVLFSAASDPRRVAPRGRRVDILQRGRLSELPAVELIAGWRRLQS